MARELRALEHLQLKDVRLSTRMCKQLRALTRLHYNPSDTRLPSAVSRLTALQRLELSGDPRGDYGSPPKYIQNISALAGLTKLHSLELEAVCCEDLRWLGVSAAWRWSLIPHRGQVPAM